MYPTTTQIYPSCHPLSLHDALPISLERGGRAEFHRQEPRRRKALVDLVGDEANEAERPVLVAVGGDEGALALVEHHQDLRRHLLERLADRSEEHTSELQSLMRISYDVFCLKQNKISTQYIQS